MVSSLYANSSQQQFEYIGIIRESEYSRLFRYRNNVDLVFYHRILRCFVLIDLKINEVKHGDISQMNMYMGYFDKEENAEGDNPPIGIILSREKDELLVEYATYGMNSQLFVSKYQLYLPNKEELRRLLNNQLADLNTKKIEKRKKPVSRKPKKSEKK